MNNIYLPFKSKINRIVQHTDIEFTFFMEYRDPVKPGQFFEVSIPKYGEAPISVSDIGANYVGLTIRRVGIVTNAIHELEAGGYLFLRGPYGNGFDIELYKGKELVIAAGGSGLAPVKAIIDYFTENCQEVKSLNVITGFKSTKDILFRDDLKRWEQACDVTLTVERLVDGEDLCRVGLITRYIPDIKLENAAQAQAIIVGPPIMIKFTVAELLNLGIREENIWVSYERKMCCGVGKCGHCKMDDTYICLEGPVFNYTKAKNLID